MRVSARGMPDACDEPMGGRAEPPAGRLRLTVMTATVRTVSAVLVCGLFTACASPTTGETSGDGGCVSHYEHVRGAPTWAGLRAELVRDKAWGRVASVRTQARGHGVGAGDRDVVRVIDLLDRAGARLVQADVWRTDAGAWRAGVWSQCID